MAKTKPESLLVMPVSGKYCEIISGQVSYKIWKVHPSTPGSYGTKIPYDVAVECLKKSPSVITVVPVIEKEKFVSQLLEEDQLAIKEAQERGFSGGVKVPSSENFNTSTGVSSGDPKALAEVSKSLKEQVEKNSTLEVELASLKEQVEALKASYTTQVPPTV